MKRFYSLFCFVIFYSIILIGLKILGFINCSLLFCVSPVLILTGFIGATLLVMAIRIKKGDL